MSGPRHDASLYRERDVVPIRRALISVSDKTGLLDLAKTLAEAGVEISQVPHELFKQRCRDARAVIRTGECSPYANVILHAGVIF